MKTHEILQRVKEFRDENPNASKFLCLCVDQVFECYSIEAIKTREFILFQLDGAAVLEEWLNDNYGSLALETSDTYDEYNLRIKATRDAWLVHMIEFCKQENI